jgi:hypothetical protein
MIGTNGDIQELTLPGTKVVGVTKIDGSVIDDTYLGGKILETSMFFGSDATSGLGVSFYVTFEDYDNYADTLQSARSLVTRLQQYVDITAEDGSLNVELKLTDGQYAAVLAGMLATDLTSLSDVTDVDPVEVVNYLFDLVKSVPEDTSITSTTLGNTLNKLGQSVDVSAYDQIARVLRHLLTNVTVSDEQGEGDTYRASFTYDLNALLDTLNLGDLGDTIRSVLAESTTGIQANVSLKVDNLGKSYQAMVVDPGVSGLRKLSFYNDEEALQAALTNQKYSTAVVILLDDYTGTLTTDKQVLLDLNGKTVNGDLVANGQTIVLDSSANNQGKVTGTVSGQAILTAGQYAGDVTAFLAEGYQQNGSAVENIFYTWSEDADGNYTISLNAAALKIESVPSLKALAVELAADIALKHYTCASLAVDDYSIYSIQYDDLVGLYKGGSYSAALNDLLACIHTEDITALANELLDTFTDFTSLDKAMQADGTIASYTMTTKAWTVAIDHVTDGDYLTVNVLPGEEATTRTVTLRIQDDADATVKNLVNKLKDILTVDTDVQLDALKYANSSLIASGSASADVVLNLTGDANYAAVVAVILANGTTGTVRDNLIAAITTYTTTGKTADLKTAIEAVTTSQLVSSLKKLERGEFEKILSALGLSGLDDAKTLEAIYDDVIVLVGKAASYVNISGSDRTIASFAKEETYGTYLLSGTYAASKTGRLQLTANAALSIELDLLVEDEEEPENPIETPAVRVVNSSDEVLYSGDSLNDAFAAATSGSTIYVTKAVALSADVTISTALNLVGTEYVNQNGKAILLAVGGSLKTDAELTVTTTASYYTVVYSNNTYSLQALVPELTGNVSVVASKNVIAGYTFDSANGRITIDTSYNGITEAQLKSSLSAGATNSNQVTYTINGVVNGMVVNGATVTVTASNPATSQVDTEVYTIIILGDTNGDGVISSGDAVLMMRNYVYGVRLTEAQRLAADVNQNGKIDSGDAVRNATKYTYLWDQGTYKTALQ